MGTTWARARPSGLPDRARDIPVVVLDCRPAGHRADVVQRHQGGPGRSSSRCAPNSPARTSMRALHPVSTETEFRDACARLRPFGPRLGLEERGQRRRGRAASTIRSPRCIRTATREAWTIINALAPGFTDGLVRKYGRRGNSDRAGHTLVEAIAREAADGGRALIGRLGARSAARPHVEGHRSGTFGIQPDQLRARDALRSVNAVGRASRSTRLAGSTCRYPAGLEDPRGASRLYRRRRSGCRSRMPGAVISPSTPSRSIR